MLDASDDSMGDTVPGNTKENYVNKIVILCMYSIFQFSITMIFKYYFMSLLEMVRKDRSSE